MNNEASPSTSPLVESIARRLKSARQGRGLSVSELARRAAVAKSTVAQLEAGRGNPSVETIWALATALDVPFARLIEAPTPSVEVIRSNEGRTALAERTGFTATLLAARPPGLTHNLYRVELAAGAERQSSAHRAATVEHLFVARGRMRAGPIARPTELDAGDYMVFPGDAAHVYSAIDGPATALLVMEYEH